MSADSGKKEKERGAVVTWGPQAAIVVTVLAFILSQVLAGILFALMFVLLGWNMDYIRHWTGSPFGQCVMMAVSAGFSLGVVAWFLHMRRSSLKMLGFSRKPQWRDAALTALGFLAYFGLLILATIIAGQIFGVDIRKEQELGFESVKAGGDGLVWVFLSLVVLPPFVEEILFRGFLYGGLRTKLSFSWTVVITSALFALPHLFATSNGFLWIAAIDTFMLSIVLCYVREKTGALWACIGIHAIKNSLAFLFVFVI